MNPPINKPTEMRGPALVLLALIVLLLIYGVISILSTIKISNNTGLLSVTSADKNATISVTRANSVATVIGVGSAKVHLDPGSYQVAASDKGKVASVLAQIVNQQTTAVSLSPSSQILLPSVLNINFGGVSSFVNIGLSGDQAENLELNFFKFKPTAQTVTINTASITRGAYDPDTSSSFSINFNVTIDSVQYNAVLTYDDITHVRLYLFDPSTGAQVFDSGYNG